VPSATATKIDLEQFLACVPLAPRPRRARATARAAAPVVLRLERAAGGGACA
jgi:hypothetical protein